MRASTVILALAGTALALPDYQVSSPVDKVVENVHVVYETVIHTVYYTPGAPEHPKSTPQPAKPTPEPAKPTKDSVPSSAPAAPAAPSSAVVYVPYSEAPAPAPTSSPAPAPAPSSAAPTSAAPAPSPSPSAPGYQAVVDTWRAKLGLKPLANDAKLQSNAMDTVVSSNGQMIHKLNPGSFAQVLAPGNADDFEHVFVGGWLCELPSLPGLDGVCSTASDGWAYNGQTGHAEILSSDSYSKIGCALYAGIWCCDLA